MQISLSQPGNNKSEMTHMKVSRPLAGQKGYDIRPDVIDDRILILQSCVLADERMEDIPENPL
jgi:hypothetical protein